MNYLLSISGAKYATLPQNDLAPVLGSNIPSLDRPKSVNKTCPSGSMTILSGFRSLKITSLLCKSSNANNISHKYNLTNSSGNFFYFYSNSPRSPPAQ